MEQIDDYGQIHPDLVLSKDRKVPVQNIAGHWIVVFAVRCNLEPALSSGKQIIGSHYPGDPGPGNSISLF